MIVRVIFSLMKEKSSLSSSVILTDYQIEKIIEGYRERGADEDTIIKEVEAFAVASSIGPETIAGAVDNLCRV